MSKSIKNQLSEDESLKLLEILKNRFEQHKNRHPNYQWETIKNKLENQPTVLWSIGQMEISGGEPDLIDFRNNDDKRYYFVDCSPESPKGRRSFCYDQKALDSRKENKPQNNAETMAAEMGTTLLSEEQYRFLQAIEAFDLKTSSWIKTPDSIRVLGGALFCDRRYNTVFTYHNGAESYYAARGFRTIIIL